MNAIRRYLLGELPEADAQRMEEEYFTDDERFGELLAAEDDLIDAFLHRALDAADRARFESRFLATARGRQKVALAATLQDTRPLKRFAWGGMLAAAAALLVVVVGTLAYRQFGILERQVEQLERERIALRNHVATPIFSAILSSGERGSGHARSVVLSSGTPAVVETWLLLPPSAHATTYAATLQSVEGRNLWTVSGLTPRSIDGRQAVVASIPSGVLQPGTFVISLSSGSQGVEDYSFNVQVATFPRVAPSEPAHKSP